MSRDSIKNDKSILNLILENFDKPVAVILNENEDLNIVEKKIEVWAVYDELKKAYEVEPKFLRTNMLQVMRLCVNNNWGLRLNGIIENIEFDFDSAKLQKVADIVNTNELMIQYLNKKIDEQTLISKIKNIDVYFIGEFPNGGQQDKIFGIQTLNVKESDCDALPVFLVKNNSKKFNSKQYPLTKAKLEDVMSFFNIFNIIIEPGLNHWVLLNNKKK